MKIRNIIKEEISTLKEEQFNGMRIIKDHMNNDKPEWNPLYEFLQPIFDDKYKEGANGFMWLGTYELPNDLNKQIINIYKHGITRKSFALDNNGTMIDLIFSKTPDNNGHIVTDAKPMSTHDAFKYIYDKLTKFVKSTYEFVGDQVPTDAYLLSYNEFINARNKAMDKAGYKSTTIKGKDDLKKY